MPVLKTLYFLQDKPGTLALGHILKPSPLVEDLHIPGTGTAYGGRYWPPTSEMTHDIWDQIDGPFPELRDPTLEIEKEDTDSFSRYLAALCPDLEKSEIDNCSEFFVAGLANRSGSDMETNPDIGTRPYGGAGFVKKFFECWAQKQAEWELIQAGTDG
ncbi:hypothetical protein FRB96_002364 [Tulasnella sp. 330]|nr:hypothetical protein FRB96_002364 [Tulasnella sp. 330]